MRLACVAVVLLTANCARSKPETTVAEPQIAAPSAPGAQPATTRPPAVAKPTKPTPAPGTRAGTPAQPAATKVAPSVAAAPSLDLDGLKERLRETKAMGFFTKITLKNQVDDLMDRFPAYHQGKATVTMTELRRSYELMLMKVLSVLQDQDRALASDIVSSREAIWGMLADPKKFATLQG